MSTAPADRALKGRRIRATLMVGMIALGVTGILTLANVVSLRYSKRFDVTATGEQKISQRTEETLARLDGDYRVVVATDLSTLDSRSRERAKDVLEEMTKSSRQFSYTFINTASASGVQNYKILLRDLVQRDQETLRAQSASIDLASGGAVSLAGYLSDTLSQSILGIRDSVPGVAGDVQKLRDELDQAAALSRISARELSDAAGKAADSLKNTLDGMPLPATDIAATTLGDAYAGSVEQLNGLIRLFKKLPERSPGPAAEAALALVAEVESRRDRAAVVLDTLRRVKRPDVLRVADVLKRGSAALIIGPRERGLAALELDTLFPPTSLLDSGAVVNADLRRRAEELLSTSLGLMLTPTRPVVVVVHAEMRPFLDEIGAIKALSERLRVRGIDVIEWAAMVDGQPPQLAGLNPDNSRPVVYVVLCPDSTGGAPARGALTGAQRALELGKIVTRLTEADQNVLLSLSPSLLPTHGEPDPLAPALAQFGLAAESGRPLLAEVPSPQGRQIVTDQVIMADDVHGEMVANPILGAVRGLPTYLPWPIAVSMRPVDPKVRIVPTYIYSLPAGERVWAESQWMRLWQTPREARGITRDLPSFDDGRDGRWPEGKETTTAQRWALVAAVQRFEVGKREKRLLVVGSNGWFVDAVTQQQIAVDGRPAMANPGNLELFEAGIFWLAGQDALIAQSPTAKAVPMLTSIDETKLKRLRLSLIAGMPLSILLLGMLYRLVRG